MREIERGMLISEEILRHLVTVLEDRGPIDELAPAAIARSLDDEAEDDDTSDDTSDDEAAEAVPTRVAASDEPDEEPGGAEAEVARPPEVEDYDEERVAG